MPRVLAVVLVAFVALIGHAVEPPSDSFVIAGGLESACATNIVGLGMCILPVACEAAPECDAATPCGDGTFCAIDTCCPSALAGVCVPLAGVNAGCSNPGTCTAFSACEPVVGHVDFSGLTGLSTTVCGGGGALFVEDACAGSVFAPSPLDHGRWGVGAASCDSYASAGHRVVGSPGPLDVSGCDRAVLDFDYLFHLDPVDGAAYDRGFVTVSTDGGPERVIAGNQWPGTPDIGFLSLSCAGGILPIGNLIADGGWHHFRAGVGDGDSVEIRLYAETSDGLFNSGQGWLFDDLRIDCGDLIFGNGFEGTNLLSWSATTALPPLVEVDVAGSCLTYLSCSGPDGDCFNFATTEGETYCLPSVICEAAATCIASSDCAANEYCVTADNCCGEAICLPATCDGGEPAPFSLPGSVSRPTSAGF
jgi:hypothetical protein